ncbi:hypothetical protein HAX54_017379 [Datura stramonium]|uniref:Protein CHUP1, chloroplastic n=1 Tax=Datura stramonium TaxID=4076 RepID=A0ABS8S0C3_DATST|nr:hypothetical protein [Datura stramonium]
MSKSVEGVLDEKYPAFKDRHKLAVEREKQIKVKAEQARAARFEKSLPPKLAQLKEKPVSLPGSVPVLPVVSASGDSAEQSGDSKTDSQAVSKMKLVNIEKRPTRTPRPPPKRSGGGPAPAGNNVAGGAPGGPPPPPPPPGAPPPPPPPGGGPPRPPPPPGSLMKGGAGGCKKQHDRGDRNRSTFLAVKADVESQDEELSFLVDERAVLKHFDWPEGKADALREAAFEYQDLMKLEKQLVHVVTLTPFKFSFTLWLIECLCTIGTRDMAASRYRESRIPTDWLQDSGVVGKIKLSSVQLARKYMKRVASELDAMDGPEKEPNREFLILQGVRFAFRVHQFAGGFDAESMKAFEELRSRETKRNPFPSEARKNPHFCEI